MLIIRDIPKPPTFNEIIGVARQHKYASARLTKQWRSGLTTFFEPYFNPEIHPYNTKVYLAFDWFYMQTKQDPDNLSAGCKYLIDALRDANIIKNDSFRFIHSTLFHNFSPFAYTDDGRNTVNFQTVSIYITEYLSEYKNHIFQRL